jgi:hypothetical protein
MIFSAVAGSIASSRSISGADAEFTSTRVLGGVAGLRWAEMVPTASAQ